MTEKILTLENVSKYYTSGQSVVMGLNNISLSFEKGEFVAVTGESGSGKSTLAKVIAGILPYENGEMTVAGEPTYHYDQSDWEHYRCDFISFISQSYDILPGCTVQKNVTSALILTGMDKKTAAGKTEEILRLVDLWEMKNRRAAKLSSGQKQRLSIARALAKPAPILIADEPTGNLDRENSEMVIKLLTEAAKERLVIMITHDFAETEDYATRRITIREGVVDADIRLREVGYAGGAANNGLEESVRTAGAGAEGSPATEIESKAIQAARGSGKTPQKKHFGCYTALLQMNSRPVWTAILFFLFAVTAFSVFAFLGTFIVNLDDEYTRIYDPSAFPNGSRDRIVVMKEDGSDMTKEDWDTLKALPHVESVERYGYLADMKYFYREDIDYFIKRTAEMDAFGYPTGAVYETLVLNNGTLFLQTIPYPVGEDFLAAGRLPENMYEVVAAGGEELLGTVIPLYIKEPKKWSYDTYIKLEVTVVGVTDKGSHLYFDEELGRVLTPYFGYATSIIAPMPDYKTVEGYIPQVDYHMPAQEKPLENRLICSAGLLNVLLQKFISFEEIGEQVFDFKNLNNPEAEPYSLQIWTINDSTFRDYMEVSPEIFSNIVPDTAGNQVSLAITDYSYTDRVLESLKGTGYLAISPYQNGSTMQDEELAAERVHTLKICLLAFIAVFVLQIVVLRALFGMEIEEFKLLANLGLRCETAKNAVLWQMLFFTAGGQFLSFLCIYICNVQKVERIVSIVKYIPLGKMSIFLLIHILASLITALWLRHSITRQVYPFSVRRMDLELDDEKDTVMRGEKA